MTIAAGAASLPDDRIAPRIPAACAEQDHRHRRILALREAIEGGDYRVSAADLAEALLRAARRAN